MRENKYNPNFNTGRFRHPIVFQTVENIPNENGFKVPTYVDFKKAWAMIKTVNGREYYEAASTKNENTYRFIIRYISGLHEDLAILYKGRIFEIETILPDDEEQGTLTIIAVENVVKVDSYG